MSEVKELGENLAAFVGVYLTLDANEHEYELEEADDDCPCFYRASSIGCLDIGVDRETWSVPCAATFVTEEVKEIPEG